jgi:hypothetical protein
MLVKQCLAMRRAGLIGPQREVTMIRPPPVMQLKGHRNSDSAREQVFFEFVRPDCASAAEGSRLFTGPDTYFVNIVWPHRTPWFISGWRRGNQ